MNKQKSVVAVPLGLGNRIKTAREARGWNQADLGKAVGVSKAAVSQWEKGAVQNLKIDNLFAVAQVLGMDVRDLVLGTITPRVAEQPLTYQAIPPRQLELLRNYDNLPKDVQRHIRGLMAALAHSTEQDSSE